MTTTNFDAADTDPVEADLRAADVAWDLEPLVDGKGEAGVDAMLEEVG